MPNGKGFRNHADEKTQPDQSGERGNEGSTNGYLHPFNEDQKVTNVKGSMYQDFGGGISDNFDEKDVNLNDLQARNKKGQMVTEWNATSRDKVSYDGSGLTAYNGRPIPEVYEPATSQKEPNANAVEYNTVKKDRNP